MNKSQITNNSGYLTSGLSTSNDSEQEIGLRYASWNDGVRRMNIDPRWNESGYDGDLGTLHIWAWQANGTPYGRAGIALFNGGAYQYLTTRSGTTGLFVNNNEIIHAGNIGSQSVNYASSAGNADTVDSLHASSFVRSDQNSVTIQRHLDASTTWTNDALTLFLGWYSGKLVVGNNNEGNHDSASALGGNTIAITNTLYSFEQSNLYYDGSLKLFMGTDGTRNTGWAYHTNNGTGLHWPNNGWHIYPVNASDMYIRSGASDCSLKFTKSGESGSYIHCSSANEIGFLTTGRSWSLRVDNSGNTQIYGSLQISSQLYFNSSGYGIQDASTGGSTFGNVATYGEGHSSWPGYAIKADAVFMARDIRRGIFIPSADSWLIRYEQSVNEAFVDFNLSWGSDIRYKSNIKTIENSPRPFLHLPFK
jgi:hypothetical protein